MEIKNILKIPFSQDGITKEELYTYVAYIDESGKVSEKLFSDFLLDLSSLENNLSCWEDSLDSLFSENLNLKALNTVFADMQNLLGENITKKYNIYIQTPIPQVSLVPFGDMNRDGITEKLLDSDDCKKAYECFVIAVKRRFSAHNLPNVNFAGFVCDNNPSREFANSFEEINAEQNVFGFIKTEKDLVIDSYDLETQIKEQTNQFRIFTCAEKDFLTKCAVSTDELQRIVYKQLANYFNDKSISDSEPIEVPIEEHLEEHFEIQHEENIEMQPTNQLINADDFVEQEYPNLNIDVSLFEEEIPQYTESIVEEKAEITDEDEVFQPVLDGTANDNIFVDMQEGAAPRKAKKKCYDKKRLMIGAGVATAVLGLAYIIKKISKD